MQCVTYKYARAAVRTSGKRRDTERGKIDDKHRVIAFC